MKILVIGSSYSAQVFADYLADNDRYDVYATFEGTDAKYIGYNCTECEKVKDFAVENNVALTIVCDRDNIAKNYFILFVENNLTIFSPYPESAKIAFSRATAKKFMHKNKIPTPKFGVFEKPQAAIDWARAENVPIVVKTDLYEEEKTEPIICKTFPKTKKAIESLFESGSKQIILEHYIEGQSYTLYVISDGFNSLDIDYCTTYKNKFSFLGASYIDEKLQQQIQDKVVMSTISSLVEYQEDYMGILGIDFIIDKKGDIYTLGYCPFFKDIDAELFVASIQDDIVEILNSAIIGTLLDSYKSITKSNINLLSAKAQDRQILTVYARTPNEAKEKMINENIGSREELEGWQI